MRTVCRCLAAAVIAAGCSSVSAVEAPLPARISLFARATAPGEPVRIQVDADAPLARPTVEFLGRTVFLVPLDETRRRWSGWEAIGLDQPPGLSVVEVRGIARDGRSVVGTLAWSVEAREFPVERLRVAPGYVDPPSAVAERLAAERRLLREVYARRRDVPPTTGPFVSPVPGRPTSVFGTRRVFNETPRDPHSGLDLHAPLGTPVVSAGDGIVACAQELYYSGGTVIVDHGGGLFTIYAHLAELGVDVGRPVARGEQLGLSGATGRVTGPHLHWGGKIGDRPFDPRGLLDPALFVNPAARPAPASRTGSVCGS